VRYIDEACFRFNGPAARKYISQARTLAGRWLATIPEHQQDGVYRARLADGTLVDITMVGRDVTIEITDTTATREQVATRSLAGFILTPSSTVYPPPDGLDGEFPEVLLSPVRGDPRGYVCWFSNADTDARRIASAARRYLPLASEGFKKFGEVDWQGDRRRSLSFRGPANRYFPDLGAAPAFDVYVWSCGRLLFDGAEYAARDDADSRSGWPIAGAAMREIEGQVWLVCVHADAATIFLDDYTESVHNRSTFAVIRYRLDFETFGATDEFVVMGTFSSCREGTPFLFDAAGERAIRVVAMSETSVSEIYDTVERIDAAGGFTSAPTTRAYEQEPDPQFVVMNVVGRQEHTTNEPFEPTTWTPPPLGTAAGALRTDGEHVIAADYSGSDEAFMLGGFAEQQIPAPTVGWTENYDFQGVWQTSHEVSGPSAYRFPWRIWCRLGAQGNEIELARYARASNVTYVSALNFYKTIGGRFGPWEENTVFVTTVGEVTNNGFMCGLQYVDLRSGILAAHRRRHASFADPSNGIGTALPHVDYHYSSFVNLRGAQRNDAELEILTTDQNELSWVVTSPTLAALGLQPPIRLSFSQYRLTGLISDSLGLRSTKTAINLLCNRNEVVASAGAGTLMEDRVRTKNGAQLFGTWAYLDGRYFTSMASFANPFFNSLTGALPSTVTGVQGAAAFYPGSVMPHYLPE
jgi:hypothetical protein